MSENKLQEYSDRIIDNKRDEVARQIDEVALEILTIPKAKLPEEVFVEYFLDFFRNGGYLTDSPLLLKWIELSGSMYNEVEIIDNQGNILYVTPPLMGSPELDSSLENTNFSNIVNTYQLKANNLPVMGLNYLNTQLNGVDKMVTSGEQNMYTTRWLNIFNLYSGNNDIGLLPTSNTSMDDLINYD